MQYNFPLNSEVCIYRFTASFGKIKIEGVVKEKEEAKKEYSEAVREGRKTAYGDLDKEKRNIFNTKIGNIPPY